jgi:hypothetical protein
VLWTSKARVLFVSRTYHQAYALDHCYNSLDCRNSSARPGGQTAGDWAVWQNKSIHCLTQSARPYSVRPNQSISSVPGTQDSQCFE